MTSSLWSQQWRGRWEDHLLCVDTRGKSSKRASDLRSYPAETRVWRHFLLPGFHCLLLFWRNSRWTPTSQCRLRVSCLQLDRAFVRRLSGHPLVPLQVLLYLRHCLEFTSGVSEEDRVKSRTLLPVSGYIEELTSQIADEGKFRCRGREGVGGGVGLGGGGGWGLEGG